MSAAPNPQLRLFWLGVLLWWAVAAVLIWQGHAAWVPLWLLAALLANPLGLLLCGLLARRWTALPWRVLLRAWWREVTLVPCVFGWQQPFCAGDHADALAPSARPGVVLVHGLYCNRGFWNHWLPRLRARGTPFVAVTLAPVLGDLDGYVPTIEAAVARLEAATGQPPLLVGHSMGGLAIRAWLRATQGAARVRGVVTLGSPHRGTWLARWALAGRNVRQMCPDSAWLTALAAEEPVVANRVCIYSDADQVVFPPATAVWSGARACLLPGVPHVGLAFDERAWALVLEQLGG